ncbi:MAG: protein translocase subunit SecD [bacterium]|nr:MAG: protein translocase subunit SecD [bacterium]
MKNFRIRLIIVAVITLVFLAYALPNFISKNSAQLLHLPKKSLRLGLDLKGGVHLVLSVHTKDAVNAVVNQTAEALRRELPKQRIGYDKIENKGKKLIITLIDPSDNQKAVSFLDNLTDYTINNKNPKTIILTMKDKKALTIEKQAVEQSIEIIRSRIDQFGVTAPTIVKSGDNQITVDLPGLKNTQRAISLIGKTARLEFHLVDDSVKISNAISGELPADDILLYQQHIDPATGDISKTPVVVKKEAIISGTMIKSAAVRFGGSLNQPYVAFTLNSNGATIFSNFTGSHIGQKLAIVMDGVVYSAPVIQERIGGGSGQITGSFTTRQAHDLAIVLRSGSLPAKITIDEKTQVGPSLGADSIHQGLISVLLGFALVVIFMVVYYSMSGVVADIALILNIIIIFGALALFKATLTLPGIAGIVLTIGMAVDANVLIYERIREEIRVGRGVMSAIEAGYKRATVTILDANITTLITALVLYQFGTGPIRGFAVTMSIGIIASMFTAVIVTRLIFDLFYSSGTKKRISI